MNGSKVIIDTNLLILLSKGQLSLDQFFAKEYTHYAISIVTKMEALGYPFKSKAEEDFVNELVAIFDLIHIDDDIANRVITLRKKYRIKLPDAIICATALTHNALLYSNDNKLPNIVDLKQIRLDSHESTLS